MARDLARRAAQSVEQQQANGRDLRAKLVQMEAQFQRAMPKGVEAVQLIRDVMTCMSQTPKLALCDAPSLLGAAMTCAQLGLRPGVGALGQAWILPFFDSKAGGQRAQLIIGYKGYVELGHRSDRIASLHSRIVYANDDYELEYRADGDTMVHRPCLTGERGEARLFYAVGRMANGGYSLTDPMTVADMQKHRDQFAMARKNGQVVGPWVDHFDAMGQKTMLLRLMNLMPKSTEIQRAIDNDGSVRVDLSEGAIDTPVHIDGEVIGEPVDEPVAERESINVPDGSGSVQETPPPADDQAVPSADEPPADPPVETRMATKQQLAQLKRIRDAERYDTDVDWFSYVRDAFGVNAARDNEVTYDDAARVIAAFTTEEGNA